MTDKIIQKQLAELGFETKQPAPVAPVVEPYVPSDRIKRPPNPRIKRRDPDLFEMPDIPPFLDRRKTKIEPRTDWQPTPPVGNADMLAKHRAKFEVYDITATHMGYDDWCKVVDAVHVELGNVLEHLGLIWLGGNASNKAKLLLWQAIRDNTKHYDGNMYRALKIQPRETDNNG
jgi:hypothetical protein